MPLITANHFGPVTYNLYLEFARMLLGNPRVEAVHLCRTDGGVSPMDGTTFVCTVSEGLASEAVVAWQNPGQNPFDQTAMLSPFQSSAQLLALPLGRHSELAPSLLRSITTTSEGSTRYVSELDNAAKIRVLVAGANWQGSHEVFDSLEVDPDGDYSPMFTHGLWRRMAERSRLFNPTEGSGQFESGSFKI